MWSSCLQEISVLGVAHSKPDPPKMQRNLRLDVIVTVMVYFNFACLIKPILYNSSVTETKNVSILFYKDLKLSFST